MIPVPSARFEAMVANQKEMRGETFRGMPVYVTPMAMNTVARFPDKKNTKRRRRRVIGKHGSWWVIRPGAYFFMGRFVVHPEIYAQLKKESRDGATAF